MKNCDEKRRAEAGNETEERERDLATGKQITEQSETQLKGRIT